MKAPLFVRPLTTEERQALQAGLRAREALTLRRCQILLASADGKTATQIAALFGCATQTMRNTLRRIRITHAKKWRDRLIELATARPDWVQGFQDEVWWSRFARPSLKAWCAGPPLRLRQLSADPQDAEPKALSCYGLLRADTGRWMCRGKSFWNRA